MADFEDQTRSLERELDGLFASVSVSLAPSVVEALADEQIDREALLALRPDDLVELNLDGETERRVLEAQRLLSREASLEALLDAFVAEADAAQAELAGRDEAIRAAVERCVRRERAFGPEATVELFGSALNGLRVGWSADVDLCVRSPAPRATPTPAGAADEAAALEAASGAAGAPRCAAHHADRVPDLEADDAAARAAATPAVDAAVRARERADRLADKCKKVVYPLSKAPRAAGGFADLEVVRHARVPLVKASFRGVAVDVVPGNDLAVVNSRLLRAYCGQRDCRRLCLLAKRWAGARGLNRAPDGFLSSYAHTLTVLAGDLHAAAARAGAPKASLRGLDVTFVDPGPLPACGRSLPGLLRAYFAYMVAAAEGDAALSCRARAPGDGAKGGAYRFPKARWKHKSEAAAAQCAARLSVEDPFLAHDAPRSHDVAATRAATLDARPYRELKAEYARALALLDGDAPVEETAAALFAARAPRRAAARLPGSPPPAGIEIDLAPLLTAAPKKQKGGRGRGRGRGAA
ncbi:RNA uridylyltransferase [Aureococcus anophagefferens]|nr:RNA uridylyltransferase [Aureococcus anophagefferens]